MASQNSLCPFAHCALIVLFLRPPKTPDKALFLGVPIMPDTSALFFRVAEKAEIAFFMVSDNSPFEPVGGYQRGGGHPLKA